MNVGYLSNLDSTNYARAEFKSESIKTMVQNRNQLLIQFGKLAYKSIVSMIGARNTDNIKMKFGDSPKIRIIGNPHQPSLIFDNKYVISLFVKNFNLYFSTSFKNGEVLSAFDLNLCDINLCDLEDSIRDVKEYLENNLHMVDFKSLYRVEVEDNLYFTRFDKQGHAYFTKTNPQFYFRIEDAENIVDTLFKLGYKSAMICS